MNKTKVTRKSFIKVATAIPFLGAGMLACGEGDNDKDTRENAKYEIEETVKTTLTETLKESSFELDKKLNILDIDSVMSSDYGKLEVSEGEAHILDKTLLQNPNEYIEPEVRKSLLFFPQITDIHITDVQSPMRALYAYSIGIGAGSAYRPQSIYSTHVLNSMVQTINSIHKKESFDCVIATGDMIDNAESIEMHWFNTLMNGGVVRANSGNHEDPVEGSANDFTDPYVADGLSDDLNWYASLGNHDILHIGINYITDEKAESYILGEISTISLGCGIYTGTQDASTEHGDPKCAFEEIEKDGQAKYIPVGVDDCKVEDYGRCDNPSISPDIQRTPFRTHDELIEDIEDAGAFDKNNTDKQSGYYFVRPNKDIPIELIFLDLSASKKDFIKEDNVLDPNQVMTNALLGQDQYNWLRDRLDKLEVEGVASIIVQHQPTTSFHAQSKINSSEFVSLLKTYEDVLAIIAGHTHKNKIRHFNSEAEGEYPLVEIVSSSLLDFPEQSRIYELVYNDNGSISLFTTMLNHASKKESFSHKARRLSLAYTQVAKAYGDYGPGSLNDRNKEIIIPISEKLQAKLESITVQANYVKSLKVD